MSLRPYADTVLREHRGVAIIKGPTGNYRIVVAGSYKTIALISPALSRDDAERWAINIFTALTAV